ncbi:uncharacterized protein LOC62_06G008404 [Vanrija pseudolonga]|uniref:Uncharacterized protein n=1 Tax=Vanrija pseudolonga TaxID=143232 RepID=A0AAF0YJT1_9TREE|nr:hypothetical protein LOC62_06G008404 [Vanrija pseudolonga]
MSSSSNTKARHYATLASQIRQLNANLGESHTQFALLADHLDAMRRFSAANAAQFMAVSRLLDVELQDVAKQALAAQSGEK